MDLLNRHKDEPAIIIGSGGSVNTYDVSKYKQFLTFGINYNIKKHDWYNYYTIVDMRPIAELKKAILEYTGDVWLNKRNYSGTIFKNKCKFYDIFYDPSCVLLKSAINVYIRSTFWIAFNLAYIAGCNPIYLIGFDGCVVNGSGWWYGGIERSRYTLEREPKFYSDVYDRQLYYAKCIADQMKNENITVKNLSINSRCRDFEFMEL